MIDDETQAGFDLIPDHPMTQNTPSETTRELRLKLALAKILSDEIEVTALVNFKWRRWPYAGEILRDTEWDYVVRKVVMDEKFGRCDDYTPWIHEAEELLYRRGIKW